MGENTTVICDNCNADLTYTGNCEGYYLVLGNRSKRSKGGFVTAMAIYPPVERTMCFCGLGCLKQWMERSSHDPA